MQRAGTPGRLRRRAEFLRAASKGRKTSSHALVLQCLPRGDDAPARLGFTVTKKVGNAVVRNRTRRRLREAARLVLAETPVAGVDLVLIGRDATRARPFTQLMDDFRRALGKVGAVAGSAASQTAPHAASDLGTGPDTGPGANPGADPGTNSGTGTGTGPGTVPGTGDGALMAASAAPAAPARTPAAPSDGGAA